MYTHKSGVVTGVCVYKGRGESLQALKINEPNEKNGNQQQKKKQLTTNCIS